MKDLWDFLECDSGLLQKCGAVWTLPRCDTGKLLKTPTKPCQCVAQFDPKVEVLSPLPDRVDTPKWTPCLAHENTWTLGPFPVFIGCNSLHFSLMDGIIVMAIVSSFSGRRRAGAGNPLQNKSGFGSVSQPPNQIKSRACD